MLGCDLYRNALCARTRRGRYSVLPDPLAVMGRTGRGKGKERVGNRKGEEGKDVKG